jgi:hypothetical protein
MLRDRPDAAELLELLDFHPPLWDRYYHELWSRYPTLAEDWVHVGFLNLPATWVPDEEEWKWQQDLDARRRQVHEERVHRDQLILAEIRGKVLGLMAKRGAERARAQRKLDQRLDELGLRPIFPGGTHIPKSQRPAIKKRYKELQSLIDELRTAAAEVDATDPKYRLAFLIRFPLFSEQEIDVIFGFPYPRHGATADAAMAVLATRFQTTPDTLERYLFPR